MAFINAVCAEGNHNQSHIFPPQAFRGDPSDPPLPAMTASLPEQAQVLRHRLLCSKTPS